MDTTIQNIIDKEIMTFCYKLSEKYNLDVLHLLAIHKLGSKWTGLNASIREINNDFMQVIDNETETPFAIITNNWQVKPLINGIKEDSDKNNI